LKEESDRLQPGWSYYVETPKDGPTAPAQIADGLPRLYGADHLVNLPL